MDVVGAFVFHKPILFTIKLHFNDKLCFLCFRVHLRKTLSILVWIILWKDLQEYDFWLFLDHTIPTLKKRLQKILWGEKIEKMLVTTIFSSHNVFIPNQKHTYSVIWATYGLSPSQYFSLWARLTFCCFTMIYLFSRFLFIKQSEKRVLLYLYKTNVFREYWNQPVCPFICVSICVSVYLSVFKILLTLCHKLLLQFYCFCIGI